MSDSTQQTDATQKPPKWLAAFVEAEAEIVSMTRSTAVVKIEVRNASRIACIAQGTVLIRDPR